VENYCPFVLLETVTTINLDMWDKTTEGGTKEEPDATDESFEQSSIQPVVNTTTTTETSSEMSTAESTLSSTLASVEITPGRWGKKVEFICIC
jgi:hypothetical protein